jgi:hypothetical protein
MKTYRVVFVTQQDETFTYDYRTGRGALAAVESVMFTFARDRQVGDVIKVTAEVV